MRDVIPYGNIANYVCVVWGGYMDTDPRGYGILADPRYI